MDNPMELPPGNGAEVARLPTLRNVALVSHPARVASGVILLVAAWIGWIAEFLDVGILVARKRFITDCESWLPESSHAASQIEPHCHPG